MDHHKITWNISCIRLNVTDVSDLTNMNLTNVAFYGTYQ